MTVLLVRHADAGDRGHWTLPDRIRPLEERGREQARGLVRQLGDRFAVERIVSSPAVRCIDTVAPLAAMFTVSIELDPVLFEGESPDGTVALARGALGPGDALVLCSHGDIIPAALEVLEAEGLDLGPQPRFQKGSTWVLDGEHGRFHTARYLPPPH